MSDAYQISEEEYVGYKVMDGSRPDDWSALPKDPDNGRYSVRKDISRGGPVPVRGYIQTDTFEVGTEIKVEQGPWLGPFFGNLKDGLRVTFDSDNIKGSLNLYLRNGNEIWGNCNFENPQLNEDEKWFSF